MIRSRVSFKTVLITLFSILVGMAGSSFVSEAVSPDPVAVQEVRDGKRKEANAAWWGFDPEDSTEYLQAAMEVQRFNSRFLSPC